MANIALGVCLIVAAILDIVLLIKRNSSMGKGAGIALGVFGIIFGAALPGIFFIADLVQTRK